MDYFSMKEEESVSYAVEPPTEELVYRGVHVAGKDPGKRWDLYCRKGEIHTLKEHEPIEGESKLPTRFICPSLCHPHIHLDKCFLLSHPKYADLETEKGDFDEAMSLTSKAKLRFEIEDLVERGRALIEESIAFGVTHMRAFVEVDLTVQRKCLEAGKILKREFKDRCYIQLCVFAQDPIVSYRDRGKAMKKLLDSAVNCPEVEAIGCTPYVEKDGDKEKQIMNMRFAIETAKRYRLHIDFHLDYNLDSTKQCMVLEALTLLHKLEWPSNWNCPEFYRHITFGHCTRLTLFKDEEWCALQNKTRGLPVSFIGLPNSDLFMMGRPADVEGATTERVRGTLQVPHIIRTYGINSAMGINNVGNAFTPQGSCDPLALASMCVGLYHAGTKEDAQLLLQCVSNRAKLAMGVTLSVPYDIEIDVGEPADFIVFGEKAAKSGETSFRTRKTIQDVICDPGYDRTVVYGGRIVSEGMRLRVPKYDTPSRSLTL